MNHSGTLLISSSVNMLCRMNSISISESDVTIPEKSVGR